MHGWIFATLGLVGCNQNSDPDAGWTLADGAVACFPECRAGTVCSPAGMCVSGCNPACDANQTCVGSGATARCVTPGVDAGTPDDRGSQASDAPGSDAVPASDGSVVEDATTPIDLGSLADVPAATDAVSTGDLPSDSTTATDTTAPVDLAPPADTTATTDAAATDHPSASDLGSPADVPASADVVDAGSPDAHVPPINCGMPGQSCCVGRACYGGGYCSGGTCAAPSARDPDECSRAADCTAGRTCGGLFTCRGGADGGVTDAGPIQTRGCFLCSPPPGAGAFDTPCTNAASCVSGLCAGGRCTEPCEAGGAGDATCAAYGAAWRCVHLLFTPVSMGPVTTLGACAQSCARQGDCAADQACVPRLNYFADRMDFVCSVPSASLTGRPGDPCNPSGATTCRNTLCVATSSTAGYCTAPCAVDADCPAAAPVCDAITLLRPSGMGQAGRVCRPR